MSRPMRPLAHRQAECDVLTALVAAAAHDLSILRLKRKRAAERLRKAKRWEADTIYREATRKRHREFMARQAAAKKEQRRAERLAALVKMPAVVDPYCGRQYDDVVLG